MNKEILEDKIAKLLKVSDQEKNLAFKIFKEKLSEFLKIGEAIRINNLGVFQLKEQLDHRSVSKSGEKSKSLTLVFSPESDDPSTNSLFVNLEIDKSKNDETEFNENVFQLGIGKPLVIDSNQTLESGENLISDNMKIENEVSLLFDKSEKLIDFDLWEDYLERKETKNILEDSEATDLSIDSILNENDKDIPEVDLDKLDDGFIPETEDEIFDDLEEKNILEEDDLKDLVNGIDNEDINVSDSIDESLENIIEEEEAKLDEIDLEYSGDEELHKEETESKSFIEKIDEELAANEIPDKPLVDEPIYEDELNALSVEENLSRSHDMIDEEISQPDLNESIDEGDNIVDEEIKEENLQIAKSVEVKNQNPPKKSKSLILILVLAFIAIGAIGIYYLFLNSSQYNNQIQEEQLVGEDTQKVVTEDESAEQISQEEENNEIQNEELIESPNKAEIKALTNKNETKNDKPDVIENEREVEKNIYYDGFVYNVQISSWKQEKIAQNEVNKLVKGGFPAYKVKVYIPKFDGYWHRVRIGPFTSLQEAEETLKKVNK